MLRFDLRRNDIGVSLVCPGAVDTGLVETVEIAGVDKDEPSVRKERDRFQRHAATPEQAAERIVRGIERNRYWVYTSRDIQVAHFLQRRFETGYALVMRLANDRFRSVMKKARGVRAAASIAWRRGAPRPRRRRARPCRRGVARLPGRRCRTG